MVHPRLGGEHERVGTGKPGVAGSSYAPTVGTTRSLSTSAKTTSVPLSRAIRASEEPCGGSKFEVTTRQVAQLSREALNDRRLGPDGFIDMIPSRPPKAPTAGPA